MNITGTYFEKMTSGTNVQNQVSNQDNSFSQALDEAANKQENSKAVEKSGSSDNTKKTNKQKPAAQNDKKTDNADKTNEANPAQKPEAENVSKTEAPKEVEVSEPVVESGDDNKKLAETIVEEVANSLGISNEALMQILAQLNIAPTELTDMKNISLVVQKVVGVESSVELLNMEGVTDLFAQVEEAVNVAVEKVAVEKTVAAETISVVAEPTQNEVVDDLELPEQTLRSANESTVAETETKVTSQSETQNSDLTNQNTDEGNELFGDAEITFNSFVQSNETSTVSTLTQSRGESLRSINPQDVTNQIIEKVKVDIKPGVSEIKLNLKPESLGEISLRIASDNGIITAHFVAENQRVKEIIESNFNQLQDALGEQGINVMELSVSISSGNNEQQMQEFIQGRAKSQARISRIISGIDENGELIPNEVDEAEIYENNVNYKA